MGRLALALVLLAALAAAAPWLLRGERGAPVPEATASAEETTTELEPPADLAPASVAEPARRTALEPDDSAPELASAPSLAPPPEVGQPRADEGVLRIRVLAQESGEPLAGAQLILVSGFGNQRNAGRSRGRPDEALVTDRDGRAEFVVPSGKAWQLLCNPRSASAAGGGEEVPALRAGEERELELRLATRLDRRTHVRVVDGESGEPLAGAACTLVDGPPGALETDADGRVDFPTAEWRRDRLRVDLEGYSLTTMLVPTRDERAQPFEVALLRAATLAARVTDAAGEPLRGAVVLARASLATGPWEATTGARGECVLERLPARTALDLEWSLVGIDPLDALARREPRPLLLRPGEVRNWTGTLAPGVVVSGAMLDEANAPVRGAELWLRSSRNGSDRRIHADLESGVAFGDTTDALGRFEFRNVPPGEWLVDSREARDALRIAAPLVEVTVGESDVRDVQVAAWRGLGIRGRVVRPDGTPHETRLAKCRIAASSDDWSASAEARDDGTFAIGPLAAGEYELVASGGLEFADSRPVVASAGSEGVQLALRLGARVSGSVTRRDGEPAVGARVHALSAEGSSYSGAGGDGEFLCVGLPSGPLHLLATTPDGEVARLDLELAPGESREGVALHLVEGARVRLRVTGGPLGRLSCSAWSGGREVASASLSRPFGRSPLVVPAGRVELRFEQHERDAAPAPPPQTLELAPGETRTVVVTLEDAPR